MDSSQAMRNVKRFYWFKSLSSFGLALPVIVLFWQENGLSMTQIMLLQSIFAICIVGLEVPTGYLADIWGRKKTLILASFSTLIAYIAYALSSSFSGFLIAEICFSIAISLLSGSAEAFLYDTLIEVKKEHEYKKYWGRAWFYQLLTIALMNIIGGFLGKVDYRLPIILSIPIALVFVTLSFTLREPKRHKMIIKEGYLKELWSILHYALYKNDRLKWLIIYAGVIFAFYQSALWFYQPYFSLSGLDVVYFGVVFASFQLVAAISTRYAHRIEGFLGEKQSLVLLFFLVVTSFLLMGNFIYWFSFVFAFMQQFIRGFMKVVISDYVNKMTDSSKRATVLSIQNMFGSLLYALIIPFFGRAADLFTLQQTLLLIGLLALAVTTPVLLILHKKNIV